MKAQGGATVLKSSSATVQAGGTWTKCHALRITLKQFVMCLRAEVENATETLVIDILS
uniref:hypothetical protein n=1 Tax=Vibrio alginolyticus TaxID=663 RepID=UPI000A477CB8|nr:hypothetical protein [Vibrio alginolyticus]